jgi:DNA helicase TIP49 (TBP-interacting protein)
MAKDRKSKLEPLRIIIRGEPDSGKTTVANLIRDYLITTGFETVALGDLPPLSPDKKPPFPERLARNLRRPIYIRVALNNQPIE